MKNLVLTKEITIPAVDGNWNIMQMKDRSVILSWQQEDNETIEEFKWKFNSEYLKIQEDLASESPLLVKKQNQLKYILWILKQTLNQQDYEKHLNYLKYNIK